MSSVKQVSVRQGDTLREIAARELNDASRWTDLISLNSLQLPFIVASYKASDRLPGTLIWGDTILIPWVGNAQNVPNPISDFGMDIQLSSGALMGDGKGDLATVSGVKNIVQALSNLVRTQKGELVYHLSYGCNANLALGLESTPFINLMASAWVQEALKDDPRVQSVKSVNSTASGDTVSVVASVVMVGSNTPVDLNLVLNP